jgi:hypothetical protein
MLASQGRVVQKVEEFAGRGFFVNSVPSGELADGVR